MVRLPRKSSEKLARIIRNILLLGRGFFLTRALITLLGYYVSLAKSGAYMTVGSEVGFNGVAFSGILVSLLAASVFSLLESLQPKKPQPNLRTDLLWTAAGVAIAVTMALGSFSRTSRWLLENV